MSYEMGSFIGDVWANHKNRQAVRSWEEAVESWRQRANQMEGNWRNAQQVAARNAEMAAGFAGESHSLEFALYAESPDHPILKSGVLARIAEEAKRGFAQGGSVAISDGCVSARRIAPKPAPGQSAQEKLSVLNDRLAQQENLVERLLAELHTHRAQEAALGAALRDVSPGHPLLTSRELREQVVRNAVLAFEVARADADGTDPNAKWLSLDAAAADVVHKDAGVASHTQAHRAQGRMLLDTMGESFAKDGRITALTLEAQALRGRVDELGDHATYYAAQTVVLGSELQRLHPTHPLVTDEQLRGEIARFASAAYAMADDEKRWDALGAAAQVHMARAVASSVELAMINAFVGVDGPFVAESDGPAAEESGCFVGDNGPFHLEVVGDADMPFLEEIAPPSDEVSFGNANDDDAAHGADADQFEELAQA